MGKNCPLKKKAESHKWETISESTESVERNVNGRIRFSDKVSVYGIRLKEKSEDIARLSDSSPTRIRLWEIFLRWMETIFR